MPFEVDPKEYDFRDDRNDDEQIRFEVTAVVEHLRETLTHDMAARMIPNRLGVTPSNDKELEEYMEILISEAYNDGYSSWDQFPY